MAMAQAIEEVLGRSNDEGLRGSVKGLVRASMAAHEVDPELHRLLEKERPLLEENMGAAGDRIHRHVQDLLLRHRSEMRHPDLRLAAWMTMKMNESLVHATVLEGLKGQEARKVEAAIVDGLVAHAREPEIIVLVVLLFAHAAHTRDQCEPVGEIERRLRRLRRVPLVGMRHMHLEHGVHRLVRVAPRVARARCIESEPAVNVHLNRDSLVTQGS